MKILILTLFSSILLACGTTSKGGDSGKANQRQETNEEECAITIRFISKGSGIDFDALKSMENFLNSAKEKYGSKMLASMKQQGREGERNFCIRFQKIDTGSEREIRAELEKIVNSSKLVKMD